MSISKLATGLRLQANNDFVFKWQTTTPAETMVFPLKSEGSYNVTVDWGDGSSSALTSDVDADASHEYADAGEYTVTIPASGTCSTLYFWYSATGYKVTEISNFGSRIFTDLDGSFGGLTGCSFTATDTLDISGVTTLIQTFGDCSTDLPNVSGWDTSSITSLRKMFTGCTVSNPDVSSWVTTSVTDMNQMFNGCSAANPDVSSWNVGAVTDMDGMFRSCLAATPDVSSWTTGALVTPSEMFRGMTIANPDVSGWNTALVADSAFMFYQSPAANPDCRSWSPASLATTNSMFASSAISDANYSALLIAWEAHASTPSSISLTNTPASYTAGAAAAARASLIGTYGWTITDNGPA